MPYLSSASITLQYLVGVHAKQKFSRTSRLARVQTHENQRVRARAATATGLWAREQAVTSARGGSKRSAPHTRVGPACGGSKRRMRFADEIGWQGRQRAQNSTAEKKRATWRSWPSPKAHPSRMPRTDCGGQSPGTVTPVVLPNLVVLLKPS